MFERAEIRQTAGSTDRDAWVLIGWRSQNLRSSRVEVSSGRVQRGTTVSTMSTEERTGVGRQLISEASRSIIVIDRGSEEGLSAKIVCVLTNQVIYLRTAVASIPDTLQVDQA